MRSLPRIIAPLAFSLLLMIGSKSVASAEVTKPNSNADDLTILAKELVAAGNPTLGLQVFDRAIQVAQSIGDRATKINALSDIAVKLAEVRQTTKARQLFDRAVQLTKQRNANFTLYEQEPALRDVAIKMAQAGFTTQALQLTKTISSNYRQAEALNGIAPILAEKGQLEQARKTLLESLTKARGITGDYVYESNGSCGNNKFDILSKIAGNLSLLSQYQTALQVAKSVTGCSSASGESGEDYQSIAYLGILSHLANVEQVKQTWTSAQTIQSNIEKAQVWSAIAVKLAAMNQADLALSIASKIKEQIPNVTKIDSGSAVRELGVKENALKDIAVKLAEVGKFPAAKQVAEMIRELTAEEEAVNEGYGGVIKPSIKSLTWMEIARQLARAKQIDAALQMAKSIEDGEAKALGIIAIGGELQKAGEAAKAENFLSQNLQLPAIPAENDFNGNQAVSRIAVALVTVGQVDRGLSIAQSLKNDTTKEETLGNIASQLAEIGQLDRALTIAKSLNSPGYKQAAYSNIAAKFLAIGQPEKALQIAQNLEDDTKIEILAKIAASFAKLGQTEKALQLAQTISNQETKASALANIATMIIN